MRIPILSLAILHCCIAGPASSAETNSLLDPGPPAEENAKTAIQPEAVILHSWVGVRVLGFNAQGHLLVYRNAQKVFAAYDLTATNEAVGGWPHPEGGKIVSGAMSADGQTLATVEEVSQEQCRIRLWNSVTGVALGPTFAPSDVGYVAFSPDGKILAGVAAFNGTVRLWDVTSGALRSSMALPRPMQATWIGLQFSPDGRHLAARNSYGHYLWNVADAKPAAAADQDNLYREISPDWKLGLGRLRDAATTSPRVALIDLANPAQPRLASPPLPEEKADGMDASAFSTDGRLLALSLRDNTLCVWDTVAARFIYQTLLPAERIRHMTLSADNRWLATFELNRNDHFLRGSVRFWDAATGQLVSGPHLHAGLFWDWWFDRDSRFLIVSYAPGNDIGVNIWKLPPKTGPALKPLELESPITPVAEPAAAPSPLVPLPPEVSAFIAAKENHARSLVKKLNYPLAPEAAKYYQAARAGNWMQASNLFARAKDRINEEVTGRQNALAQYLARQTMIETHIALEFYTQGQPKYATAFGRDIVASVPPGSIYFGGTDPGRGLVTALCQSHADADPIFVLSQNPLADGTYLDYLRQTYGERIYVPSEKDSQKAFSEYLADAQRRLKHDQDFPDEPKQIRPGESVKMVNNRVQVSGQVAVMSINALLAKVIFDRNPQREFYLEESFPIDWMYPHLEPHGLIMKLNREPLDRLSPEAVKRDQAFWSERLKPLIGDWLREDTSLTVVCDFAERVHARKDLNNFAGDPLFVGDPYACKAFAKLRVSLAGLFRWRAETTQTESERQSMIRAADWAFRQALVLCPYNSDVVERYADTLSQAGRKADALRVAKLAGKFPDTQKQATRLIRDLSQLPSSFPTVPE